MELVLSVTSFWKSKLKSKNTSNNSLISVLKILSKNWTIVLAKKLISGLWHLTLISRCFYYYSVVTSNYLINSPPPGTSWAKVVINSYIPFQS